MGVYRTLHSSLLLFCVLFATLLLLLLWSLKFNMLYFMIVRTPQNESLLLLAIRHKLESVADQLCELLGSAVSSVPATDGNTPLWVALRSRQESIASKLVRCGLNIIIGVGTLQKQHKAIARV